MAIVCLIFKSAKLTADAWSTTLYVDNLFNKYAVTSVRRSDADITTANGADTEKVGLNFSALVFITIKEGDKASLSKLEQAVDAIPQITNAQRLFGTPDYLLHVVTKDLAAFQQLYDDKLSALPGVQRLTSTIVMKDIVRARNLHF